jgi:hypothetical protein
MKQEYIIIIVISILVVLGAAFLLIKKSKSNFDISVDPLKSVYNPVIYDCDKCAAPVGYGMNREHNKDIGICSFIKQFDSQAEFVQNVNQDACEIPARQICEVLYQYHQQYFENMWSGLGECEIYQKEKCKQCPAGLLKIKNN